MLHLEALVDHTGFGFDLNDVHAIGHARNIDLKLTASHAAALAVHHTTL